MIILVLILLISFIIYVRLSNLKTLKPRILVSYVYHEQPNTKENLNFFVQHGLCYPNVYAIVNVKGPAPGTTIARQSNIMVIHTPNKGFDYAGHRENFKHIDDDVSNFDYVVLMNDSVCGPFITNWYEPFIKKLEHSEYVGVIKNQGWFNMVKVETVPKIIRILEQANLVNYHDAHMMERKLRNELTGDNILKIDHWIYPHTPFEAIFVKENRIGTSKGTGGPELSYITVEEFKIAKKQVFFMMGKHNERVQEMLPRCTYNNFKTNMSKSDKTTHHGYERFYYPILIEYEHEPVRFLEIGVENGKSMDIWKSFFSNPEHIYGIGYKNYQTQYKTDVNDIMTLFMGDQSNIQFLNRFINDTGGNFDIIVDDGSHVPSHVIISFETLWKTVKPGGVYIIEDIETSYWKKDASIYGYSFKNEGSVIEYFKNKVDEVNNEFRSKKSSDIISVTFTHNMIIIKKVGIMDKPYMNRSYRFQYKCT